MSTISENNASYIVIQPANPQVIYVPQYDPTVIWGPPPVYYPYPSYPYVASSLISFGTGIAVGALIAGGSGWGWGFGWGNRSVTINNNFIRGNRFTNVNVANGNQWRHNPAHRAGVPYNNRAVSNRYNQGQGRANVAAVPMQPKRSSVWDKRNARRQAKARHSGKAKGRRNAKAREWPNGRPAKATVDSAEQDRIRPPGPEVEGQPVAPAGPTLEAGLGPASGIGKSEEAAAGALSAT